MTITQQQQLALQRGLLYDIGANKLVTFDPVAANTKNVGQLPRTSQIQITVPKDSEGLTETVFSFFPLSSPGATVNITEGGKNVTDVATWNRVQGATASKYIFIRDILSAESIPVVGNSVESHPEANDSMYENSTKIVEINPAITMKIIDIYFVTKTADTLAYQIIAIPESPGDFRIPANSCVGAKFIFTASSSLNSTAQLVLDTPPSWKKKFRELLGYDDFEDENQHTQVTFKNLIEDVFGNGNEVKGWGGESPSTTITNGRNQIKCWSTNGSEEWSQPVVFCFEFFKSLSECLIFNNGSDIPNQNGPFNSFGLLNSNSWTSSNTNSSPGLILFNSSEPNSNSKVELEPNTGDGGGNLNETPSDLSCDLLCYKLNKPLKNFINSAAANSKTNVTNVGFDSNPVPTEVVYNGDSINKDTLLDSWESGYHMAGRILQNKLKK